jgi:hypothetical protein
LANLIGKGTIPFVFGLCVFNEMPIFEQFACIGVNNGVGKMFGQALQLCRLEQKSAVLMGDSGNVCCCVK